MTQQNKKYHLEYKHIKPRVIKAIRKAIIDKRIFKSDFNERKQILSDLLNELCEIYKISEDKKPILDLISNSESSFLRMFARDGCFNHLENKIYLNNKLSLITFLHEFKHFLQYHFNKTNSENIARAYSISAFYQASPKHFRIAIKKGLIFHQSEE